MKMTIFYVLLAIALFSDGNLKSEALPLANIEDTDLIQDSTGEGLTENIMGSKPGVPKIIMVVDANLLRMLKDLERNMPERILNPESRDGSPDLSPSISIIRRETKRCMVGRVYRPCWEI